MVQYTSFVQALHICRILCITDAHTERPKTKRPKDKRPKGPNVPSDKTFQGQNVPQTKRPKGQNVPRDKCNMCGLLPNPG